MAKYISRNPKVIEATQWFPGKFVSGVYEPGFINAEGVNICYGYGQVVTIQGQTVQVNPGEWIITEPDGIHHYPCDPKVFEETYKLLGE